MNRLLRQLGRRLGTADALTRREVASLGSWLALVVVLEASASRAHSDTVDALAIGTLACAVWMTSRLHRAHPLRWLSPLTRRVSATIDRALGLGITLGVDMRATPPIQRAAPRVFWLVLGCTAAPFVAAALGTARWPEALRELSSVSYVLYTATLGVLWLTLVAGVVLCAGVTLCALHDALLDARQSREPGRARRWLARQSEPSVGLVWILGLLAASFLAPPIVAAGLLVGLWLVHGALVLALRPDLPLLWRNDQGDLRTLPWTWSGKAMMTALLFGLGTPLLLAVGAELIPSADPRESSMPITLGLGRLFAWTALGAYTTAFFLGTKVVRLWSAFRSARGSARRLHVEGQLGRAERRSLGRALEARGWRVSFTTKPHREALHVQVDPSAPAPGGDPFGPSWPGVAPSAWLESEVGLEGLEQRWQRQQRRRLLRGLHSLFRGLAAREFQRGQGCWVAPNLWYVTGITRDTSEDSREHGSDFLLDERIGSSYEDVFPWSARLHFHEVLRALEVDLIFVEDGVRFRRFRRVLDSIFELYDIHGGTQRAEERHFTGLPGLSVVVIELGLDESLDSEVYPEPDYEDIGRARILHVFRDRGGEEEDIAAPEDVSWTPVSEWGPLLPA